LSVAGRSGFKLDQPGFWPISLPKTCPPHGTMSTQVSRREHPIRSPSTG
jgi:hypothetical protein